MQRAADAYRETDKATKPPRQLEAMLLLKAASRLQGLKENWEGNTEALGEALYFNRRLWTIFLSSVAGTDNPLSPEIKNNIASIGAFILHHTITVQRDPAPEKLTTLISINREIAAGLNAGS